MRRKWNSGRLASRPCRQVAHGHSLPREQSASQDERTDATPRHAPPFVAQDLYLVELRPKGAVSARTIPSPSRMTIRRSAATPLNSSVRPLVHRTDRKSVVEGKSGDL